MVSERDVRLADGRVLRVHDAAAAAHGAFTIVWHHGSPQTGAPLAPLVAAASERGIRLLSYGRPSYGGSSPRPGRDVASAAADVAQLADALGVGRFAVMGASGGGPHALACAALLGARVTGAACLASLAPIAADVDWFAGMVAPGGLRAAVEGREARARHAASEEFDEDSFTAADWAALSRAWVSLGRRRRPCRPAPLRIARGGEDVRAGASKVPEDDALSVYRASVKAYTEDGTLSPAAQERIISFRKNEVKIDKDVPAQRIFNFSLLQSILSERGKVK